MFCFRSKLVSFSVLLLFSSIVQAGSVTSGPQVGAKVPGPFKPLNVTGPGAGQTACLYCKYGARPVAVIFAKTVTAEVVQLLKKIDTATAMNKETGLGSFAVVCSNEAGLDRYLANLAQQMKIQNTVLALYKAGGPEKYHLSAEADVTVVLYNHFTVKANRAFKSGELTEAAMNAILADMGKMLSEK